MSFGEQPVYGVHINHKRSFPTDTVDMGRVKKRKEKKSSSTVAKYFLTLQRRGWGDFMANLFFGGCGEAIVSWKAWVSPVCLGGLYHVSWWECRRQKLWSSNGQCDSKSFYYDFRGLESVSHYEYSQENGILKPSLRQGRQQPGTKGNSVSDPKWERGPVQCTYNLPIWKEVPPNC